VPHGDLKAARNPPEHRLLWVWLFFTVPKLTTPTPVATARLAEAARNRGAARRLEGRERAVRRGALLPHGPACSVVERDAGTTRISVHVCPHIVAEQLPPVDQRVRVGGQLCRTDLPALSWSATPVPCPSLMSIHVLIATKLLHGWISNSTVSL